MTMIVQSCFRFRSTCSAFAIGEAWLDTRDLPRHYTATTPSVADRYAAEGLEVPE